MLNFKKDIVYYGFPSGLRGLISLVLLPFFTSIISPNDYGVYTLILIVSTFCQIFVVSFISSSIGPVYYEENSRAHRKNTILTAFTFLFVVSSLVYILLFLISNQILDYFKIPIGFKYLIFVQLLCPVFQAMSLPMEYDLKFTNGGKKYSLTSILAILCNSGTGILLVLFFKMGIAGLVWGNLVGAFVFLLCMIVIHRRKIRLYIDRDQIMKMLKIGLPMLPSGYIIYFINTWPKVQLENHTSVAQLGVFNVVLSFCTVLEISLSAINNAWYPYFISYKQKTKEFKTEFHRSRLEYTIFMGLICLVTFIVLNLLIPKLLSKDYFFEELFLLLLVFSYFIRGYNFIFYPAFYFFEKLKYILYSQILSISFIFLFSKYFITQFGMTGAAMLILFGHMFGTFFVIIFSRLLIIQKNNFYNYDFVDNGIMFSIIYYLLLILIRNNLHEYFLIKSIYLDTVILLASLIPSLIYLTNNRYVKSI